MFFAWRYGRELGNNYPIRSGFTCVNLDFRKKGPKKSLKVKFHKNKLFLADFEPLAQFWVIFGNFYLLAPL